MSKHIPVPVGKENKSIFNESVNSFPEAVALPLQYVSISEPEELFLPGGKDNTQQLFYQTPPQYGYSQKPAVVTNQLPMPALDLNKKSTFMRTLTGIGLGLVSLLLICVGMFTALSAGPVGAIIAMVLAVLPFTLIFLSIIWVGKWDAEPWGMKIAAFLWGGGVSVGLTLLITLGFGKLFGDAGAGFFAVAVQAPLIEEFSKGLGVFVIALFLRKYITGPVDGVVYVATIAAGFAFTENILYFSQALTTNGLGGLTFTFFLRAVFSPFAHVIFSLPMGILIGVARRKNFNIIQILGFWIIGYVPAVFLHALWNGSASFITGELWFLFYAVVQIPIFCGAIFAAVWLRKNEAQITYKRLTEYAWNGWFTPQEVESFATWGGRKKIRKWSKTKSSQVIDITKDVLKDVVLLASVRDKIAKDSFKEKDLVDERELLEKISANKTFLLSL